VPIDFGGGPATNIHPDAYDALLSYLGFEPEEEVEGADVEGGQGEGQVRAPSEKILQHFDIDVRPVAVGAPDGNPVVPIDSTSYTDEWGAIWRKAYPRAPYINVEGPFQKLVEPTPAAIDTIDWPDPGDPGRIRGLRERTQKLRDETDYAIVLSLGNTTFALSQRLRGFANLLEDLILNKPFAEVLMERVTDVVCGIADAAVAEVGDLVDAVASADDMGIQTQAFMHPDLYRSLVMPNHRRLVESVRRHTDAKMILHSDGAVHELLPDMIDAGVQVLNPVQVNADGMDADFLKREFGKDLSFWGGMDTQIVLPFGSPEDVKKEVERRVGGLGAGGGYVLASVHNILAEVPPENIVAMYETARELKGNAS
jgi:uroporphyrinogen decarboxylase